MMSTDKSTEVVGCDASIMKNVWEIRLREYGQKQIYEQKRVEKSALQTINEDWAKRMTSKQKYPKRLERKAKPVETPTDQNIFNKSPRVAPPSLGSSPFGRGRGLGKSLSAPAPVHKEKALDKKTSRLQLLMFITQTQPSPMIWGKCWKYNKSLPPPTEDAPAPSNWGQCWRFANPQPHTEPEQPLSNEPNMVDFYTLHLYQKSEFRMMESKDLDLSLPMEEWQKSWKNPEKKKGKKEKSSSHEGGKFSKFAVLNDTQHHNEEMCSSEWSESWKSTKPPEKEQQIPSNGPTNDPTNGHSNGPTNDSQFGECWRFINSQLHFKSKSSPAAKSQKLEWADSWRAAKIISNNHKKPHHSPEQSQEETYNIHHEGQESPLHKVIMSVSREQKYRDLWSSQFCDEQQPLSEWDQSWEVTKNNHEPSEELEKALAVEPVSKEEEEPKREPEPTPEPMTVDPRYEELKHEVIYRPKRGFTEKMVHRLKQLDKESWAPEWREDSWRTLKHHIRMERRRTRPHRSRPFRESEMRGEGTPIAEEWASSWRMTDLPLRQEADLWQQGWATMPRIRADRAREPDHFPAVEVPRNGPTGSRGWGESWMFSRQHHHVQDSGEVQQPVPASRRRVSSVADWQESWMVSESEFHHDRPSMTQWIEAWRLSAFHTDKWEEQLPRHNLMDKSLEIRPRREKLPLQKAQLKMSRSFEAQTFMERYPSDHWNESWKAISLLGHHQSTATVHGRKKGQDSHGATSQRHTVPSNWRTSFRLANPMSHNLDKPWVECSASQAHFTVMWSRGNCIRPHLYANVNQDSSMLRFWGTSCRFLKAPSSHAPDDKHGKGKSKESDQWVIMTKKIKSRKRIYTNIDQDKPSGRKWAGCHLLGKTQPRPKRGSALVKNVMKAAAETDDKFLEEWAESWRLHQPEDLKKQMPVKSLSGWCESWKLLLPPYPPQNGPKVK